MDRTFNQHCPCAERLESRWMLAAVGAEAPIVMVDWEGRPTPAKAGEYVLSLDGRSLLVRGRSRPVQTQLLQRALRRGGTGGVPGVVVEQYLGRPGQFLIDAPHDAEFSRVLSAARRLRGFDSLQPNFVFRIESVPNDPLFGDQFGLHNTGVTPFGASKPDADIDAPEAWDVTTGGDDVVVGVIDSGVDYTHPDLAANMWRNPFETPGDGVDNDANGYVDDVHGINAYANTGDPMDDNGHGTHVAGTIAAAGNNGVGVAGVAWGAKVMALKFVDRNGWGTTADAVESLNYTVSMRSRGVNIRVTNNSWSGVPFDPALRDAIAATGDGGMLFVAASGNGSADMDVAPRYPAGFDLPNLVAVAATDRFDNLAAFSNYGAAGVDLAAPGAAILSTGLSASYRYDSGTSMAAPHVAGVVALAWGLKPAATVAEVRGAILSGVDSLPNLSGKVASGGRLNALGTLRALTNSVSGVAFNDADGNGVRGAEEAAVGNATIWLDLNQDGAADLGEPTRITDAFGAYRFGGLAPGVYVVRQAVPAGRVATAPAAGAYTVTVSDGQDNPGRDFGTRPPDVTPPAAAIANLLAAAEMGGAYQFVQVRYTDDIAVDPATVDGTDLRLTGPLGYLQAGFLTDLTASAGAWTATYRFPAPGGTWGPEDAGTYTVSLVGNGVRDTSGNAAAKDTLGTFVVSRDTAPPPAVAAAGAPRDTSEADGFSLVRAKRAGVLGRLREVQMGDEGLEPPTLAV